MDATLTVNAPARMRRPGTMWGVAVSVVLHALLIFGYRLTAPVAAPPLPPREAMTVWLVAPPKPAPVVVARVEPSPVTSAKPDKAVRPEPTRAHPPAAPKELAQSVPIAPAAEAPSQAITLAPPVNSAPDPLYPEQDQPKKGFDMNAALKTARKVANEKDPARAGLPVAQLDDHPLYPERSTNELARKMDGAKRSDCLAQVGNLLTPLFWLLDKKDHGCKL